MIKLRVIIMYIEATLDLSKLRVYWLALRFWLGVRIGGKALTLYIADRCTPQK